ncbi:NMDA receptor-regulated protein 1 family protein [Cryptosporidium felis]|nr:NMDA receptor-regulated protein 1 family protein [Cryptosporidium felis]
MQLLKIFMARTEHPKSKSGEQVLVENEIKNLQILWFEKRRARYTEIYGTGSGTSDCNLAVFDCYLRLIDSMDVMKTDQYDYHLYCLRKLTLCRYLDFIDMQDKLFCNTKYREISLLFWRKLWINIISTLEVLNGQISSDIVPKEVQKCKEVKNSKKKEKSQELNEEEANKAFLVEFINDPEKCWSKSHEIIKNYRKDCIFHVPSYIPIYVHYYCSFSILNKMSFETSLLVSLQSIMRTFTLERSYLQESQVGTTSVLLTHFLNNYLSDAGSLLRPSNWSSNSGSGCFSTEKDSNSKFLSEEYGKKIIDSILKQFTLISGRETSELGQIKDNFRAYISNLGTENVKDIDSLCNLVKISIVDGSFEQIELFLENSQLDLNLVTGLLFNREVIRLVKLLIIRSLFNLDPKFTESQITVGNFIEKSTSSPKSALLSKLLNNYDIGTRSLVDPNPLVQGQKENITGNQNSLRLPDIRFIRESLFKEVREVLELPALALVL